MKARYKTEGYHFVDLNTHTRITAYIACTYVQGVCKKD